MKLNKMGVITIKLKEDEDRKLRNLADAEGLPMNYFLRKGLLMYFEKIEVEECKK